MVMHYVGDWTTRQPRSCIVCGLVVYLPWRLATHQTCSPEADITQADPGGCFKTTADYQLHWSQTGKSWPPTGVAERFGTGGAIVRCGMEEIVYYSSLRLGSSWNKDTEVQGLVGSLMGLL